MKSRVLGLACAAGLASGCQSSAAKALSRYQATKDKGGEVAQVSHEAPAGLPGASKRKPENKPQSAETSFEMGEKALQQFYRDRQDKPAHLQRARVSFEAAAKANPAHSAAQHRLAIIADLQERFGESESYYLTAISLDPDNANIAADLGWSFILQGRWQDAERALMRALELDPNSTIARDHLAKSRQQQSATQVAATGRGPSGQMMANRPATVGPDQPAGQGRFADPGRQPAAMAPDRVGEYLRNQLAQIDQSGNQAAGQRQPAAPMQQAQPQQYGGAPIAQAPAAQPQYSGYVGQQAMPAQPYSTQETAQAYRSEPRPTGQPFIHLEPGGPGHRSAQSSYGNMASGGQMQRGPASDWGNQGNANSIQRAQALETPAQPDQAIYQAPQLPVLPSQPAPQGNYSQQQYPSQQPQQGAPSSAPPTGYGQAIQQPNMAQQPQNAAADKARRDAALMGLGLGPGQLFPSLEQPADRMSAGSNSFSNGAGFGAPPIRSPDLTPPPDLKQMPSFFEQPPMTPPSNSMGQTMPGGTSNMMTPGTVNDPNARFQQNFVNPAANQAPQLPGPPNDWNQSGMQNGMQGYDDTRRAADQQLQQTLQNTWAGTPSGAIPSPAGGVPTQGPPPQSQMMNDSWGRQPVAPSPYPHAAPQQQQQQQNFRAFESAPLPTVNPSPGRLAPGQLDQYPPAGRVTQPVYRDGVVVPEQYGPAR